MEMIGVLALVVIGFVFLAALGGGTAESNNNDAVEDDLFTPGSVPNMMFINGDD